MIVRILGEGQYAVPEDQRPTLEKLDSALVDAVDGGDATRFAAALNDLTAEVRRAGEPLPDDAFAPSELVVPFADASLDETKELLAQSGDSSAPDDH